jgi:hypothetical protein
VSENSRKKTLPLAVLAAPALAFGSLTFAAAPAMAVGPDQVQTTILNTQNIDQITIDVESESGNFVPGGLVTITGSGFTAETEVEVTIGNDSTGFEVIGTVISDDTGDITATMQLPTSLVTATYEVVATGSDGEEATFDLDADPVLPDISADVTEAGVGDTVTLTITNVEELEQAYNAAGVEFGIGLQGDFQAADGSTTRFYSEGITYAQDVSNVFTYTIPQSVASETDTYEVEPGTNFNFYGLITLGTDFEDIEYIPSGTTIEIAGETTPEPTETPTETPEPTETPTETPEPTPTETGEPTDDPGIEAEPSLTLAQNEILLEDFIGEPEEGTGVLHQVRGAAPNSDVEYTVDTPEAISPFSDTDEADENGDLSFWIHGYETSDPSVYLGDYTTVVTFEDAEGETQELTAEFSVVEDDNTAAPVVDTDEPVSNDEDDDPAVGSTTQLADTGASGAPLAWIAGGLLAVGGAFVLYANRARLFGRKN